MSDLTLVKCRRCGYVRRISPVTIPCAKCKKYGTFVEYKAPQPTADRGTRTGKGLAEGQSEASPLSARPLSVGPVELRRRMAKQLREARRELSVCRKFGYSCSIEMWRTVIGELAGFATNLRYKAARGPAESASREGRRGEDAENQK